MKTSIVVPTLGRMECLYRLLNSIELHTKEEHEVILVVPESLKLDFGFNGRFNPIVITEKKAGGCVAAYNVGFKAADGKYLVHLNDDSEVCECWLTNMLNLIGERKVLGAFYLKEPGTDGFIVNYIYGKLFANWGCANKSLFEELGYWDERFTHFGADPDFSLKVWAAGYEVVATPSSRVIHHASPDNRHEELRGPAGDKLREKWRGIFW